MSQALSREGQLDFGWESADAAEGLEHGAHKAHGVLLKKDVRDARPRPITARNLCATCRARRAFLPGGRSVGESGRTLCFRCYHAELQSAREARANGHSSLIVERRTRSLSAQEVAHRQQMLEHLRHQAQIGARRAVGQ